MQLNNTFGKALKNSAKVLSHSQDKYLMEGTTSYSKLPFKHIFTPESEHFSRMTYPEESHENFSFFK